MSDPDYITEGDAKGIITRAISERLREFVGKKNPGNLREQTRKLLETVQRERVKNGAIEPDWKIRDTPEGFIINHRVRLPPMQVITLTLSPEHTAIVAENFARSLIHLAGNAPINAPRN